MCFCVHANLFLFVLSFVYFGAHLLQSPPRDVGPKGSIITSVASQVLEKVLISSVHKYYKLPLLLHCRSCFHLVHVTS